MAEGSGTAAECNGLNLGDFGCLDAGDISLGAIIAPVPTLFGLWMKLLGGETWRIRVGRWLYDASWITAYAGLLQKLLVRLRWFFGRPWSRRAFDTCIRLAVIYALAYLMFAIMLSSNRPPTKKWISAGLLLVVGPMSFLIARLVRCRHLRARRGAERYLRRVWLHHREHLAYGVLGSVLGAISAFGITTIMVAAVVAVAGAVAGTIYRAAGSFYILELMIVQDSFGAEAQALFAALFFIPFLNALFDWPSWAASRWLMRRLQLDATHTCRVASPVAAGARPGSREIRSKIKPIFLSVLMPPAPAPRLGTGRPIW